MNRPYLFLACSLISFSVMAATADKPAPVHNLTAEQVIAKNVKARGGLDAWRKVDTLTLAGQMEAGGKKNSELPFEMKMSRDHKSRLEITFQGEKSIQVYDGKHGWKVRPFLGRNDAEPFTSNELKAADSWAELDGPLIDYAKKGTTAKLDKIEKVNGSDAYKLELTLKNGTKQHVWIDTDSFLEVKIDGQPRKMDGKSVQVYVYYRDYKNEKGLIMPHTFETVIEGDKLPHTMQIDKVSINTPMSDDLFTKPQIAMTTSSTAQ